MDEIMLKTGLACMITAIIGGGLKAFGISFPVFRSAFRQLTLATFGLALVLAAFVSASESRNTVSMGNALRPKRPVAPNNQNGTADQPPRNVTGVWVGGLFLLDDRENTLLRVRLVADSSGTINQWRSYARENERDPPRPVSGVFSVSTGLQLAVPGAIEGTLVVTGRQLTFVNPNAVTIDATAVFDNGDEDLPPSQRRIEFPMIVTLERDESQ